MVKILVLATAILVTACGDCKDMSDAMCTAYKAGNGVVKMSRESSQRTPQGAWTFSKRQLSADQLSLIDAGLNEAFNDARLSGYAQALDHGFYHINTVINDCVLSPEQRIPSFYLRADDYDGTEFDQYNPKGKTFKDGISIILAAEMVQSLYGIGEMYVCKESNILQGGIRNGAEHIIIYNNDSVYYNQTWFHGSGVYHPLLPKRDLFFAEPMENRYSYVVRPVK